MVAILGIWGLVGWWHYFVKGLMALLPIFGLIGGVVAIASGVSDIKDKIAEKKEKTKGPEKKKEEVKVEPEKKEEPKEEEKKEENK